MTRMPSRSPVTLANVARSPGSGAALSGAATKFAWLMPVLYANCRPTTAGAAQAAPKLMLPMTTSRGSAAGADVYHPPRRPPARSAPTLRSPAGAHTAVAPAGTIIVYGPTLDPPFNPSRVPTRLSSGSRIPSLSASR